MTASSYPEPHEGSNYDEDSMQQNLMFSDTLKDLETLRGQLYSAAEYFELSYNNDDQSQILIETLKDYAIKALVNTVDHLGSATYKVNDLVDEKVGEVSDTEFRVSCIEQRLRTCQEYMDCEGRTQQSLVISAPRFHKQYILPVGETMFGTDHTIVEHQGYSPDDSDEWLRYRNGNRLSHTGIPSVRATIRETRTPPIRKGRSPSPVPSPRPLRRHATFSPSMQRKSTDNQTVSPRQFPLLRSGSATSRMMNTDSSRPTTPNKTRPNNYESPSEARISTSSENSRDSDRNTSKGKGLLKKLFGRRKVNKEEILLYTYLDEY